MGRHSAIVVPFRLGVVPQKPKEIPEYCSRDIQFDWPERYEPPFPLNKTEERLMELNSGQRPS